MVFRPSNTKYFDVLSFKFIYTRTNNFRTEKNQRICRSNNFVKGIKQTLIIATTVYYILASVNNSVSVTPVD